MDGNNYCYCKHCFENFNLFNKLIPHDHLYFYQEDVGGWHLAFESKHKHSSWYIGPNPKAGKYRSPNKVYCNYCKMGIGNEVTGKLPNGDSLFTLDKDDVAINMNTIGTKFSKKFKWKQIFELHPTSIRKFDSSSPELSGGTPFKPVVLEYGKYRDTQFTAKIDPEVIVTRDGIIPRQYQLEALSEAMARNLILVLPTGMGKTLVSVLLMQQTIAINKSLDGQRKRMVLFLVTTLPLVKQQTKAIRKQNSTLRVLEISSDSDSDKSMPHEIFEDNEQCPDVMVMTQGSFFNMEKRFPLAAFHLIIFDEAHHATGEHAYARVMKEFYPKIPHNLRPKILGLTASPSGGKNLETIERNISKLEEVLQAHIYRPPSLPRELVLEAEKLLYSQSNVESRCQNVFLDTFNAQLRAMEQRANYNSGGRLEFRVCNHIAFETEITRFRIFVESHEGSIDLDIRVGDMIRIFHKFTLVQIEGYQSFIKYLSDDLKCSNTKNGHNTTHQYRTFIAQLIEILKANGADTIEKSSRYLKLVEQLEARIATEESLQNFRGIVFVKTRDTCRVLLRLLKKESINEQLNVKMVVGHGKEDGMDTEEQSEVMTKFSAGHSKLIVATSVLEEGIDVQGCNFVLCFENDFNIRSLIQRRGRARNKTDGSFMILMNNEEDAYLRDTLNMEQMMNHVIMNKMQRYVSEQKLQADKIWKEYFEANKHQPLGPYQNIILNIYNSNHRFDDTFHQMFGAFVMSRQVLNTQESRRYLRTHQEHIIGFEKTEDSINEFYKALYSSKGWWAKTNEPSNVNLPSIDAKCIPNDDNDDKTNIDNKIDSKIKQSKSRPGPVTEVFDLCFSCGNFTDPTTFVCNKEVGLVDVSYDPAERMLEVRLRSARCKLQFKKENFDSFCLYDCDPDDNQHHTLYLVVKRPPVAIVSTVDAKGKNHVRERMDRRHHPFIEHNFVYRFKIKKFLISSFISALQIPFFVASIIVVTAQNLSNCHLMDYSNEKLLGVTPTAELFYLFAVLKSNKYTGFGKTDIPKKFFDHLSREFDKGNIYPVEYLVDQAMDFQEFDDYDHLIEMDLSMLPKTNPTSVPKNYMLVKSAFVTPSRVIFNKPRLQLGNRCLRLYNSDRFMTVQFSEEDLQSRNVDYQELLEDYFRHVMTHGIHVPGFGVFYYLGNSNSQALNFTSWFYCVEDTAKIEETLRAIRKSLTGEDPNWSSRKALRCLSLVFPSTMPTIQLDADLIYELEDIERNGHNFTEGVGYIGQETARKVCSAGGYPSTTSAFQIRIGGSKGVLSVHPKIKEGVYLRKKMTKFQPNRDQLHNRIIEVISVSGPKTCYLNRQVITLFNGLGVPDSYFMELQQQALAKLAEMFHDPQIRKQILRELSWLDNALDEVDLALNDPLIGSALQCCYMKKLDKIQDKCFIPIENARTLMGISDESGELKPNQVFVQISHENGSREVIIGKILVCKNPCLHPGDVRVLEAVDLPHLQNFYIDVIAFSQQGDVPNFKQCSGSDLDGDRYFVCFDKEIACYVTEENPYLGEDLPGAPEKIFTGGRAELVEQYLTNITRGSLGRIALSHMALCDLLSPTHPLCVELAKQHFIEVDAVKTGIHGKLPKEVTSTEHLDNFGRYPHFMESSMPRKSYWISQKVLGKMFQGASVLKAVPQFIPEIYVDESRLVDGYEAYLKDAKDTYARYKYLVKSLLQQYDIEREEDILVEFIKETINSFRYHKLFVDEIRGNYKRIQQSFKDEFLREFPGLTVEEKLRGSNDQIERKVAAWYYVSHSDVRLDHALSFYWIVKCFQPKRELKSGLEQSDYMSQSVIDFVDENKISLVHSYSERILLIDDLARLFRNEGGDQFLDLSVLMFGSSSMMLFDLTQSDLDLYIRVGNIMKYGRQYREEIDHDPAFKLIEKILKSTRSTAESIKYNQNSVSSQPMDADNVEYVKKTAVPIVRFRMNKLYCDISADSGGIRKTAMMCNIFDRYPMIFQVLFVVIRWGRETGLLVKQLKQTNSRNLKTWSLIWMVINFFTEEGNLDLSKINLDAPVDNKPVDWWVSILERSRSQSLGYYLIKFFEYYSKVLATVLRQKDKGGRLYLLCPLDNERTPSVDINPLAEEEHTIFLQEIFTIAHHTLASSPSVKVFLKRCLFEKKKIINLDKLVSRYIHGNEAYVESMISMNSNVKISIYPARRGCLQVKISGEPSDIQNAMDQFQSISADMTTTPFFNIKKYVMGGGTILLYKGSKSIYDTLSLVKVGKEREKSSNIQHILKNPKMQGILKSPEELIDGNDLLYNAKLEYQKSLLRQLQMCFKFSEERKYGRKNCYIRLGYIYLFNCTYEGAEMSIDDLQKAIAKSCKRNLNLQSLGADDDDDDSDETELEKQKRVAVPTSMRPIERSNKSDYFDEESGKKGKVKVKLPKSSFYPTMYKLSLDQICKTLEGMGWRRDDANPEKIKKSQDEEYVICCKGKEKNIPEFKVQVNSELKPPNVIKHRNITWFDCDLSTNLKSRPEANHLDVRYCIQSKQRMSRGNNLLKEYQNVEMVRKRENNPDGRLAPIEISKGLLDHVYLIRHHPRVVHFNPPHEHPMTKYKVELEVHTVKEYRTRGDLYFEKIELELKCDLPSERDTLHFSDQFWQLGVDIVDKFNSIISD